MMEMDTIFLVGPSLVRRDEITNIISLVWTERYDRSGEFNLVLDPVNNPLDRVPTFNLQTGYYIENSSSDYLMRIHTMHREKNDDGHERLIIEGYSWEENLKERYVAGNLEYPFDEFVTTNRPLRVANRLVERTCVEGVLSETDKFDNFSVATASAVGDIQTNTYDYQNLYSAIQDVVGVVQGGFRVYLDKEARTLEYNSYVGTDRTETVIFAGDVGNLVVEKTLESISDFKNTAIMITSNGPVVLGGAVGQIRRPIVIDARDYTPNQIEELRRIANDELRKHKYMNFVEGEVYDGVYIYGRHYNLGDLVTVRNSAGIVSQSRVAEYVRTYERTGIKAYPTFSAPQGGVV